MKNENGFSLIELAVSAALLAIITTLAASQLQGIEQSIKLKAEAVEWQQSQQADDLQAVLDSVN